MTTRVFFKRYYPISLDIKKDLKKCIYIRLRAPFRKVGGVSGAKNKEQEKYFQCAQLIKHLFR